MYLRRVLQDENCIDALRVEKSFRPRASWSDIRLFTPEKSHMDAPSAAEDTHSWLICSSIKENVTRKCTLWRCKSTPTAKAKLLLKVPLNTKQPTIRTELLCCTKSACVFFLLVCGPCMLRPSAFASCCYWERLIILSLTSGETACRQVVNFFPVHLKKFGGY